MYEISNPLSANSYTNKDFQSIYVELLETAKKLAHKWDPTISNESDPGVVLLKLDAIIGDKNNYNIDKNVLENYPETFTQERSARSLYRQLGYKMPWYKAASTDISFRWVGKALEEGQTVTIPRYTMLTDTDNSVVFTTTKDCVLGKLEGVTLQDSVPALQGILSQLKISGSTVVTLSNIDSHNRLYINDSRIAENGIFVYNVDNSMALWTQVENVELQPSGSMCYEFNIDPMNGVPYLQFADDIRDTIGYGLSVKYLVTNGYDGNVASNTIVNFYDESSVDIMSGDSVIESMPLSADILNVFNLSGTTDGADPETIEDAYRSFKKRVATFDTLVTLRDYVNALYSSGYISNAVVSDRTTDIQSAYKIYDKSESSLVDCVTHYVDSEETISFAKKTDPNAFDPNEQLYRWNADKISMESVPQSSVTLDIFRTQYKNFYYKVTKSVKQMNAFDLKFYMLKDGGLLSNWDDYNRTFEIDDTATTKTKVLAYIDDAKSVQHDVQDIEPYIPFMMQNIYPIKIKIVPSYKLKEPEMQQVESNVWKALVDILNSRECDFGTEPNYDIIYNAIADCDERIKVVIMDDLVFTTFATYLDIGDKGEHIFKSIPVSEYSNCERIISRRGTTADASAEEVKALLEGELNSILRHYEVDTSETKKSMELKAQNYIFIDETNGIIYTYVKNDKDEYEFKLYSDRLKDIRKQIIVKNILAGVTPLFEDKSKFQVSLGTNEIPSMTTDVDEITTSLELYPFGKDAQFDSNRKSATYTLRENENLRFLAPSFINDATYSNYVKFELVLANPTSFTTNYVNADPAESTELFARYGSNQFYEKTVDNHFRVVKSTGYENLKGVAPEFKLDSYFGRVVNLGNVVGGSILSDTCEKPVTLDLSGKSITSATIKAALKQHIKSTGYIPKFEKNLYYSKVSPLDGNAPIASSEMTTFVLTEAYPSLWNTGSDDSNYKEHYRLKQYVSGKIPMGLVHTANYTPTQPNKVYKAVYVECEAPDTYHDWTKELFYGDIISDYTQFAPADDLSEEDLEKWYTDWKTNWTKYHYLKTTVGGDDSNSYLYIADLKSDGTTHFNYPSKSMYTTLYKIESEKYVSVEASSISNSDWNKEKGVWRDYYYATNMSADEPTYTPLWDEDHSCFNYLAVPGGVFEKTETQIYVRISTFADVQEYARDGNLFEKDFELVSGGVTTDEWSNNWRNYYTVGNKCAYIPDAECYERVGDSLTHIYSKVFDEERNLVGYKMLRETDSISITASDYIVDGTTVTLKNIVMDKLPTNWEKDYGRYLIRTCSYEEGTIKGVVFNALSPVCPDFKSGEVFSATKSAGVYDDIGGSMSVPENWETTYMNYYSSTGLQDGLLENSYEMQQWKAGVLKLYVPEMSFTVPANTEYQLKSGDYLTFFWREQDDDDAPYNYVKYDDVYDKETGAPTIIKASFTINASPLNECLINPQRLGASSGKIYTNDTMFNVLKYKFYGEYDLSGTKKIEMRKMNAVKMNNKDNKYFYFISRNKDVIEDVINGNEEKFKLTLNRVGIRNTSYVKYTYVLENDEYFIYTNSSKTGFEALGAGTLIEYYEYFEGDVPTDEEKVFYAPIIDAQKIAYNGIDAFVDKCDEIKGKSLFSLVEQQIYSFTNGDSVHIQLNDDYDYEFTEVINPSENGFMADSYYTDGSSYSEVELLSNTDTDALSPPPFIKDYYYIGVGDEVSGITYTVIDSLPLCAPVFKSGTYYSKDDGSVTPEMTKPNNWETEYTEYFTMNNHKYTRVDGASAWNLDYFKTNKIYIKSGYAFELVVTENDYLDNIHNGVAMYIKEFPRYPEYSGTPQPVRNYTVSYATNNSSGESNTSSGFEMLPQILVTNEDYCWRASSHLNLSSAENKPQKIESATGNSIQSVTIGDVCFPTDETVKNDSGETVYRFDKTNPLYLVTGITIDKVGGENVDVSWVDMMNNRHPIDVFVYQLNPAFNNSDGWSYLDDGSIRLTAKGNDAVTNKTIDGIHLDKEFKYILPVTLYPNDDTTKNSYRAPTISIVATLEDGSTTALNCLCHGHTAMTPDKHFVVLPNNTVSMKVTVTGGSGAESVSAKFGYLFKYVHREMFDGGGRYSTPKYAVTTDELITELRRLDVPKVFDYTHMPDKSVRIDDPLSAYSFFEAQHVFNCVTMPRAELRFSNQLGTEVPFDSSITFVNNR